MEEGEREMSAVPFVDPDRPADPAKLHKIIRVLMDRVERGMDYQGNAFSLFQTAIVLEDKVRDRTRALEKTLRDLDLTNRALLAAQTETETARMRLMEAIESVSEGFIHFDADDRLVLCNSKFLEFFPGIESIVAPGLPFSQLIDHLLARGLIVDTEQARAAWRHRRKDRRPKREPTVLRLASSRWVQISERATRDGGIVGIVTDVTEIKTREARQRERALAEKSRLLQATLDNLAQGVSVFDADLRLVAWNDRFVDLLNLPAHLMKTGTTFFEYVRFRATRGDYGADSALAESMRLDAARAGRPLYLEQVLKDGTVLEVRRAPMPQGGFVTTYTDVTERRQTAEALREAKDGLEQRVAERTEELTRVNTQLRAAKAEAEEANFSKTRFLAAASHDLLQPLNAARLFVTALAERPLGDRERESVCRIDKALTSVEGLLGALLDISKFDARAVPVTICDVQIDDILGALAEEYGPVARKAGLALRVVPSGRVVRCDPRLLSRVLRNLVSNAIRYTSEGGVLLGCRRRGDRLRIETWDTGIGIAQQHLTEIFEEFRQVGTPRPNGERSFGLGLAIVRRIARMLEAPLEVRSTPGRGSVFAIEVPLGQDVSAGGPREPAMPLITSAISGAHVLLIENEVEVIAAMRGLLEQWGCIVTAIAGERNAAEALPHPPDVIIADYHLDEGRKGVDAIDTICAACGAAVPAMVVTAEQSPEILEGLRLRGLPVLQKPVKPARLRALLAHLYAPCSPNP